MRCENLTNLPVFLEITVDKIALFEDINDTIKTKIIQLERRGTVRRGLSEGDCPESTPRFGVTVPQEIFETALIICIPSIVPVTCVGHEAPLRTIISIMLLL